MRVGAHNDRLCRYRMDNAICVISYLENKSLKLEVSSPESNLPDKSKCLDFRKDCVDCEIRFVCGGRCLPQLLYYPDEKLHVYCDLERIAVETCSKNVIPSIEGNAEKRYH